jgi:transposase-like protein
MALYYRLQTAARLVRHGSKLSYGELKEEVYQLAREAPHTYAEIAGKLGVSENAVAKAVTTVGPKFQRLQMRIVELLSKYEVERQEKVEFRTWRKDREAYE